MRSVHFPIPTTMAISSDDRAFFIDFGKRLAQRRKAHAVTQVQLAEQLGISQQAMNSFEKGRRRLPVSLLPAVVQALDTTFDALIADATAPATKTPPKKRGPAPKIQQQLERVSALPKAKQRAIAQVLDSMLAQSDA